MAMMAFLIALLLFVPLVSVGENNPSGSGFLRYSPYGQSLLADVHPNFVRFDVAYVTNHQEWDWGQTGKSMRMNTYGVMGMNLPVWSGELKKGKSALNVTLPLSTSLWLDLVEPVTAPVVNTDYRIALPVFTYVRHTNRSFLRNYSIMVAPYKHESTHLGDEITLQRVKNELPLSRINVSYHYSEYAFTLNEPDRSDLHWHTFRLGLIWLWNARRGWYFVDETDGDASLAQPRFSPWEAYFQYQYQSPLHKRRFQYVASMEIRNRVLYGYPEFTWSPETGVQYEMQPERRIFTYNLFCGLRFCSSRYEGIFSRASIGVRFYHGNNPYGQFRNHSNYNHIGLCIVFE